MLVPFRFRKEVIEDMVLKFKNVRYSAFIMSQLVSLKLLKNAFCTGEEVYKLIFIFYGSKFCDHKNIKGDESGSCTRSM